MCLFTKLAVAFIDSFLTTLIFCFACNDELSVLETDPSEVSASLLLQAELEATRVALEQAEMSAVVAATECMNMQKVQPFTPCTPQSEPPHIDRCLAVHMACLL